MIAALLWTQQKGPLPGCPTWPVGTSDGVSSGHCQGGREPLSCPERKQTGSRGDSAQARAPGRGAACLLLEVARERPTTRLPLNNSAAASLACLALTSGRARGALPPVRCARRSLTERSSEGRSRCCKASAFVTAAEEPPKYRAPGHLLSVLAAVLVSSSGFLSPAPS